MALAFTKYRDAKDSFSVAFTNDLAAGESIISADVTVEHLLPITGWDDVSTTVLGTVAFTASVVTFMLLNAASDTDQAAGEYRVLTKVTTDGGRILVAEVPLMIAA